MAHLYVESTDGQHRVELVPDDEGLWDAFCDRHPSFALQGATARLYLTNAFEEAQQHVDQH